MATPGSLSALRDAVGRGGRRALSLRLSPSRREAISTTLWAVPTLMTAVTVGVFAVTCWLDLQAAVGRLTLPAWAGSGSPDAARQVLVAVAASAITVAGVVFSVTILVLQLASQQFGPRMLRNFIRDLGTQVSLGTYVATFVYTVLALMAITDPPDAFVPHLSVTVAVALALADVGVLIYFIHHVAASIQLTTVVSGIARDFQAAHLALLATGGARAVAHADPAALRARYDAEGGAPVAAQASGFLQATSHVRLVQIATTSDAVIRLLHRPGHFLIAGQPLAVVVPPAAAPAVARALTEAHLIGPNRTLVQDSGFAIDQLVEVALRALSPAVNDTFTALNCIDWLGDCLCRAFAQPLPSGVYVDAAWQVRLVEPAITHERLLKGATDKIRQAGRGMPAVLIRQLENLTKMISGASTPGQRKVVLHHAGLILRASEESVPDASDRRDVRIAYDLLLATPRGGWQAPARAGARPNDGRAPEREANVVARRP